MSLWPRPAGRRCTSSLVFSNYKTASGVLCPGLDTLVEQRLGQTGGTPADATKIQGLEHKG